MTYGRQRRMSRCHRDIRPLMTNFPPTILRGADMERRSTTGLEICLGCGRDFVSMTRCTRAGSATWWVLLRCGGCGTWHETFAGDEAVARLQRANARRVDGMRSESEAFREALELELIGPDDFKNASGSPSS
jgi:hypothetical protein